jgi:hypothetical protein
MVPSAFVFLAELPLNSSGKVDRLALPPPDESRQTECAYTAPAGNLEQLIARLWKEVLHLDSVGVDDNFFDIGGNSLLLARVHARLTEMTSAELSIVDMFEFPTIRSLAAHLTQTAAPEDGAIAADRSEALVAGQARLREQARRRTASSDRSTV